MSPVLRWELTAERLKPIASMVWFDVEAIPGLNIPGLELVRVEEGEVSWSLRCWWSRPTRRRLVMVAVVAKIGRGLPTPNGSRVSSW